MNLKKSISIILVLTILLSFVSCRTTLHEEPLQINQFSYKGNVYELGMTKGEFEKTMGKGTPVKILMGMYDGFEYDSSIRVHFAFDRLIYLETTNTGVNFYNGLNLNITEDVLKSSFENVKSFGYGYEVILTSENEKSTSLMFEDFNKTTNTPNQITLMYSNK